MLYLQRGASSRAGYCEKQLMASMHSHDGTLFIADKNNQRVVKWAPGACIGSIVAGGKGRGFATNQLAYPFDVALDLDGGIQ